MDCDILFAIMAVQEVVFFAPMAKRLMEEEGLKVAFLTFHEAGDDILKREGIPYFSLHKIKRSMESEAANVQIKDVEAAFKIRVADLVVHEKLTANRAEAFVYNKVTQYHTIIGNILKENKIGCVVQELGGFIAPQMLFRLCEYHDVNHVFIEPAMFPKRTVFTLNNLYANIYDYDDKKLDSGLNSEVGTLVENYIKNRVIVIPKKDKHFFQDMGLKRFFSGDNFKRLSRKLYHKYILGREEEYNAILWYALYHLQKLYRRKLIDSQYSDPVAGEKYIYFPFHVPLDVQLTVRCPEFLAQEQLVEKIAKAIPKEYKLYIKEHPAAIGGHSPEKLQKLTALGNVRLLHSRNNSFGIIQKAECVVTINSKVGFEGIMQGKPVVVLGKTFYRGKGVTVDADVDIAEAVNKAVNMDIDDAKRTHFINEAFDWSYPGELYENSPGNVGNFYQSLLSFLNKNVFA